MNGPKIIFRAIEQDSCSEPEPTCSGPRRVFVGSSYQRRVDTALCPGSVVAAPANVSCLCLHIVRFAGVFKLGFSQVSSNMCKRT